MATDRFELDFDRLFAPAAFAVAVSPHDSNELSVVPKAIYVGGAGGVVLRAFKSGADVTFKNVPAGFIIPVRAQYVRATGTTATFMIAIY